MINFFRKYIFVIFRKEQFWFLLLAMLVSETIWHKGYLFLLDWGISSGDINVTDQSILLMLLVSIGNIIYYGFFQKIILFIILYLLGHGGFLLVTEVIDDTQYISIKKAIAYIGGIFMLINPFVYERLIDGQWLVVSGMVCILFMFIFLLRWQNLQQKKDIIFAIIWGSAATMLSIHSIFFVLISVLIFFIIIMLHRKKYNVFMWFFILLCVICIVNLNIILGFILGVSQTYQIIEHINEQHFQVFHTITNGYSSIYTNVASLHGYWGENEGRFLSTQENIYIWKPIFFLFSGILFIGLWQGRKKLIIQFFAGLGLISYILALGIEGVFAEITQLLYEYIPFYIGLREPQKWVSIFVVCFIAIFTYGLFKISITIPKVYIRNLMIVLMGILIFLYTPTMLFGFYGQIKPKDFPIEWYNIKNDIGCDINDEQNILFLPWHQYIKIDFLNNKKIISPAKNFFGDCVVQSDNMEAKEVYNQNSKTNKDNIIEKYIIRHELVDNICDEFVYNFQRESIKYIILSKSDDYKKYLWLSNIKCINLLEENNFLIVYQIIN
jgi:hypothetical protein